MFYDKISAFLAKRVCFCVIVVAVAAVISTMCMMTTALEMFRRVKQRNRKISFFFFFV